MDITPDKLAPRFDCVDIQQFRNDIDIRDSGMATNGSVSLRVDHTRAQSSRKPLRLGLNGQSDKQCRDLNQVENKRERIFHGGDEKSPSGNRATSVTFLGGYRLVRSRSWAQVDQCLVPSQGVNCATGRIGTCELRGRGSHGWLGWHAHLRRYRKTTPLRWNSPSTRMSHTDVPKREVERKPRYYRVMGSSNFGGDQFSLSLRCDITQGTGETPAIRSRDHGGKLQVTHDPQSAKKRMLQLEAGRATRRSSGRGVCDLRGSLFGIAFPWESWS